jgi:hypothetical protein
MATISDIFSRYDRAIAQAATVKRLDKLWDYIEIEYDEYLLSEDEYNHFFNVINERLDDMYALKKLIF